MSNRSTGKTDWKRRFEILKDLPTDPEARMRVRLGLKREAEAVRTRVLRLAPKRVHLTPVTIPDGPITRQDVTGAVILDTFSELAFKFEWNQVAPKPDTWREDLESHHPDLLFVESAWRGNSGSWTSAMTGSATNPKRIALREMVEWCRGAGIPTVFWNKEDPPNYDKFIETAQLFDVVFTVDADRIPSYIRDLGHNRVYLLPFGAQPRIHNPIRHDSAGSERPYQVAFAGTYFAEKHEVRRRQMDYLLAAANQHDLHIYSRMQDKDKRYRFPPKYKRSIVGSLPYDRMLSAYTAYRVFLNVNSVTGSPTMCARRIFELSAAQTPIVSGPAKAIESFFDDDVAVVDNRETAELKLANLLEHPEVRERMALRAHRRVFDDHLFRHRVDTVLSSVGLPAPPPDESISAVVPTRRPDQLENVWRFMHHQTHRDTELVLVTHGFEPDPEVVAKLQDEYPLAAVHIVGADPSVTLGTLMNLGTEAASGRYVAKMDDDNFYAPHYLSDLVRAFSWTDAQVVGKWAHYVHIGDRQGPTLLRFKDYEHRYTRLVQGGTIITPREIARTLRFEDVPRQVDTTFLDKVAAAGGRVYSSDRFNFISTRTADGTGHTWGVSTDEILARSSEVCFFGPAEDHVTV